MKIWLITEHGDDYHGTRAVCAYKNEGVARKEAYWLEENQDPCHDCGHRYCYTVSEIELQFDG